MILIWEFLFWIIMTPFIIYMIICVVRSAIKHHNNIRR
jgi:hypothetical protein